MERPNAWKKYDDATLAELDQLCEDYRRYISENKTERECVKSSIKLAEEAGYVSLETAIAEGRALKAGDKVYAASHNKTLMLVNLGSRPMEQGMNILGAHIDSPRLDLKQNPLYEAGDMAYLDTHYYGGVKAYHWVATPLALHGVICKKDGTTVDIAVGEDPADPVFCISDLLIHLASDQMEKPAGKAVDHENLDVIVAGRPVVIEGDEEVKEPVKQMFLDLIKEKYDVEEEDFLSPADPVFCISDLLIHRARDPMENPAGKAVDHEHLDVIVAGRPVVIEGDEEVKEPFKQMFLDLIKEKYDVEEEDFLSAEIEVVPAGPARDMGLDRSMILGHGQDDRVCAYPSLRAQLDTPEVETTSVTLLVDKEEIGSVGASGMTSRFFENTIAEIMALAGEDSPLALRRALANSRMLSSDVSAGFDHLYADRFEKKNAAIMGHGLCFNKYTGSRGKGGSKPLL